MTAVLIWITPFAVSFFLSRLLGLKQALIVISAMLTLIIAISFSLSPSNAGFLLGVGLMAAPVVGGIVLAGGLIGSSLREKSVVNARNESVENPAQEIAVEESPKNRSMKTFHVVAAMLTILALGYSYEIRKESIQKSAELYFLQSETAHNMFGRIGDVSISAREERSWYYSTLPNTAIEFYVRGEKLVATVRVKIDGSIFNPRFSIEDVKRHNHQTGGL